MAMYDVQVVNDDQADHRQHHRGTGFRTDTVTSSRRYAIARREDLFDHMQAARIIDDRGHTVDDERPT